MTLAEAEAELAKAHRRFETTHRSTPDFIELCSLIPRLERLVTQLRDETSAPIGAQVKRAAGVDSNRIAQLEQRLARIEQRPDPKYCGVWHHGRTYAPGSMTTDKGALWYCNEPTSARPGGGKSGWTLAVKSGNVPKE